MDAVKDKYVTHEVVGGERRATVKGSRCQASNTQAKKGGRHHTSSAPAIIASTATPEHLLMVLMGAGIAVTHTGWLDVPNW